MRQLATRLPSLLVAGVLCGCTVVIGRQPESTPTPVPTATRIEIVYPTTAPVLTPTDVPTDTPVPTATGLPTATASPSPTPKPTEPPTPEPLIYTVQAGDTLSAIAASFGTTVEAIMDANGLTDPSKLSIGQQLLIPTADPVPEPAATTGPTAAPVETAVATDTATPEPPTPVATQAAAGVSVAEGTVTINIVDFASALTPLRPEDVGYPYDDLDLSALGSPTPHEYRALFLENAYLKVTVVPDLGGRVYQIVDKVSGQSLLYNNPSVTPTNWGTRGWWLAIGGIEWALPTDEHGLAEYLPWSAVSHTTDGEASVTVGFTERLTGVECQIRIALDDTHAYVKLTPYFRNPGQADERLQFWLNATYAPGGEAVPGNTRLVFPTDQVVLHSSSDPGLPEPGRTMPWPTYGPRDLSLLSEWHGYFGAFAQPRAKAGYMGAQSQGIAGLVRAFPPATATGIKFFGLGDIPYSRYSGSESSYLELWGGWTDSFWTYGTLTGGQSVQWNEYWYPLPDMPTISAASQDAALSVAGSSMTLLVTSALEVEVVAEAANGTSLHTWVAAVEPGHAWTATDVPDGTAAIEVRNRSDGTVLLRRPG